MGRLVLHASYRQNAKEAESTFLGSNLEKDFFSGIKHDITEGPSRGSDYRDISGSGRGNGYRDPAAPALAREPRQRWRGRWFERSGGGLPALHAGLRRPRNGRHDAVTAHYRRRRDYRKWFTLCRLGDVCDVGNIESLAEKTGIGRSDRRLLLRHAVQCSQPENKVPAVDADDGTAGE